MTKREPLTTEGKVFLTIGIVLVCLALFIGLGIWGLISMAKMLSDPIPSDPQYPVVFGVRVTDDHFLISTAKPCPADAVLSIVFPGSAMPTPISVTLINSVDILDLTDPGPDIIAKQYMTQGFQWSDEGKRVEITTEFPDGSHSYFSAVEFSDLQEESTNHPGQFYFAIMGWLTPEDVAARDGVDLLTICEPQPK